MAIRTKTRGPLHALALGCCAIVVGAATTVRAATMVLKPGSSFSPSAHDAGEVRNFAKEGGFVICTDALYGSIWNFLDEVESGFGDVKWKQCDSWTTAGDSRTVPVGSVPHPLVSFPYAIDDADYWGHFIGNSCKGWTVLMACGDGEPMILYRPLGKGGVIATANLWWYGEVPKALRENVDAWAALLKAGVKAKFADMTPFRNGKGRIRIALAAPLSRRTKLELAVTPEKGRKSVFSKDFAVDGVVLDYELDFVGKAEFALAVVTAESRTTVLSRTVDAAEPLTLVPADRRGRLSTQRRTDALWITAALNPGKVKCENGIIRVIVTSVPNNRMIGREEVKLPAKDVPTKLTFKVRFPKEAPAGKYKIAANLMPAMGGLPVAKAETTIEIVAPEDGQFLVDADGMILRNGEPFFPLGIYHVTPPDYETVKNLGFNFVQSFKHKMVMENGIPAAAKAGLPVLVEGDYKDIPLRALNAWLKTPPTAMWYVADEPNEKHADHVRDAYEAFRNWDKTSLTYIVSNRPDLFGWLSDYADVFACNCYGDMGKCVDWLRRANRTIRPGQAFIFVPTVAPKDIRFIRAQAFLGIAHGATGLIWYHWKREGGDGGDKETLCDREEHKGEFKSLLAELGANTEYLTSPHRIRFESGSIHGIVLGDPTKPRRAFVVNVLSKESARASVRLVDGTTLNLNLGPLEARIVDIAAKGGQRMPQAGWNAMRRP